MSQPNPDLLLSSRLRLERAKQHFNELEAAFKRFWSTEPYKVGSKHDPQTRKLLYCLEDMKPVPLVIPIIVGDVIHSLRCALDHLAYKVVIDETPGARVKDISFPIFDASTDYKAKIAAKIAGARQPVIKAIEALEPYKGGKGHKLWVLHQLDIIDKHRLVLSAGASVLKEVSIQALMGALIDDMQQGLEEMSGFKAVGLPNVFIAAADFSPLKVGDVLYTGRVDEKPQENTELFRMTIAFDEPEVLGCRPIIETLDELGNLVAGIIGEIERAHFTGPP